LPTPLPAVAGKKYRYHHCNNNGHSDDHEAYHDPSPPFTGALVVLFATRVAFARHEFGQGDDGLFQSLTANPLLVDQFGRDQKRG
jgi:hypothetical protein